MLSTGNTVTTAVTTPDPFCGESARYKAWWRWVLPFSSVPDTCIPDDACHVTLLTYQRTRWTPYSRGNYIVLVGDMCRMHNAWFHRRDTEVRKIAHSFYQALSGGIRTCFLDSSLPKNTSALSGEQMNPLGGIVRYKYVGQVQLIIISYNVLSYVF